MDFDGDIKLSPCPTVTITGSGHEAISTDYEATLADLVQLKMFLSAAPAGWPAHQRLSTFTLPTKEVVTCVQWNQVFYITGIDIVRCLTYRFQAFGRQITNKKKFEEGIFSDLRNLKTGTDAILEQPKSDFLEFLYKHSCVRTQKKQKVYHWFSVNHDKLFLEALERDLKKEASDIVPSTRAVTEPALSFTFDATESLSDQLPRVLAQYGVGTLAAIAGATTQTAPGLGSNYMRGNGHGHEIQVPLPLHVQMGHPPPPSMVLPSDMMPGGPMHAMDGLNYMVNMAPPMALASQGNAPYAGSDFPLDYIQPDFQFLDPGMMDYSLGQTLGYADMDMDMQMAVQDDPELVRPQTQPPLMMAAQEVNTRFKSASSHSLPSLSLADQSSQNLTSMRTPTPLTPKSYYQQYDNMSHHFMPTPAESVQDDDGHRSGRRPNGLPMAAVQKQALYLPSRLAMSRVAPGELSQSSYGYTVAPVETSGEFWGAL